MDRMRQHLVAIGALLALTAALSPTIAAASPAPRSAAELPPLDPALLQKAISGLPSATVTGALVNVAGPAGQWSGTSGVRDVVTRRTVQADGNFRIGSTSKIFTAVVLLQLAAEDELDLDQSVQHYLPGLLPASYPAVTVRQLLNHTSGLPGGDLGDGDAQWFADHRLDSWTPRQIVADAVTHPMEFTPGTAQRYNGTNYYVAGLLIERLTGHTYAHEVRRRVIEPLNLRNTYVLNRHDPRLPGPHAHGYVAVTKDGTTTLHDVSRQSPYPWAEGGLISNSADLRTLITAVFEGRLVPASELNEMFTLPDVPYVGEDNCDTGPDAGRACFSAGLMKATLPNGLSGWGKTGARPGYTTGVFATRGLSRVLVYSLNATGDKDGSESPYIQRIVAATFDPDLLTGN
ncbi:serine hydrolase [Actinoallomurus iriomotensis]|uniref:Serine hydrolase n=2 Tax=Actinoallomurus iriomotensis TaxID=478107 RepID=A0A9W6S6V2_9ACTN|nr:serine hydrolase [Actinoallomurus iriomotensis]